ncbi:helix-turn-helix transcriptional regulator [Paenibacillus sp. OV219]|uniref:helix-turn-helix transcriptional regulator n=1 Tax=Paenibacillus sp. OV219 TaxID=1884377 RepID=UPI0008B2D89D|nr:helix-turn-helix transcriptional regulator [Paenibacillus sp. OV219]SEM80650.1 Helix-turn-helix [Paenibacillus sp. OV219]
MTTNRKWLVALRGEMTQEEVAEKAMLNRSSYANIESGKRKPSVGVAMKIAEALGFSWTLFFDENCFESKHSDRVCS